MNNEPTLLQQWERAAIRELTDILYQLSFGSFETKESLGQRMRQSADAIELVAGELPESSARERWFDE